MPKWIFQAIVSKTYFYHLIFQSIRYWFQVWFHILPACEELSMSFPSSLNQETALLDLLKAASSLTLSSWTKWNADIILSGKPPTASFWCFKKRDDNYQNKHHCHQRVCNISKTKASNNMDLRLTILNDWASLFTTLIGFELFPLLAVVGVGFFPSISSLRLWPLDPKTFLSSQMST